MRNAEAKLIEESAAIASEKGFRVMRAKQAPILTPEQIEGLAVILWDYFGDLEPRSNQQIYENKVPPASEGQVQTYRDIASDIAESLTRY